MNFFLSFFFLHLSTHPFICETIIATRLIRKRTTEIPIKVNPNMLLVLVA